MDGFIGIQEINKETVAEDFGAANIEKNAPDHWGFRRFKYFMAMESQLKCD